MLEKRKFSIIRQTGSHARLRNDRGNKVTIALHNKPIAKGTLMSILRQADLSKEELFG